MKRDQDFFGDCEMDLVYIARRLRDALRLEEVLTESGIDYLVETDTYRGGIIFAGERVGAFFYVLPDVTDRARAIMRENRYKPYRPLGEG